MNIAKHTLGIIIGAVVLIVGLSALAYGALLLAAKLLTMR